MPTRKTNAYQTNGYECIIRLIVPVGTDIEPFPSIPTLGILLVYELDTVAAHSYGVDALVKTFLASVLNETKACQQQLNDETSFDEPAEDAVPYTVLREIDLNDALPEKARDESFFVYTELDWDNKIDRVFVLGRKNPEDDFSLSPDDIHFVRVNASAYPHGAQIPIVSQDLLSELLAKPVETPIQD